MYMYIYVTLNVHKCVKISEKRTPKSIVHKNDNGSQMLINRIIDVGITKLNAMGITTIGDAMSNIDRIIIVCTITTSLL